MRSLWDYKVHPIRSYRDVSLQLKGHKRALHCYEPAVLFIGDAANPEDPKQEQGK
nr:hypothetical protein [Nitrosomonas nitrosa]